MGYFVKATPNPSKAADHITSHWGIVGRRPSAQLTAKHTRAEWDTMACFLLKPHFWLFRHTPMLHSTVFSPVQGHLSGQPRLKQKKNQHRQSGSSAFSEWRKAISKTVLEKPFRCKDICTEELLLQTEEMPTSVHSMELQYASLNHSILFS